MRLPETCTPKQTGELEQLLAKKRSLGRHRSWVRRAHGDGEDAGVQEEVGLSPLEILRCFTAIPCVRPAPLDYPRDRDVLVLRHCDAFRNGTTLGNNFWKW